MSQNNAPTDDASNQAHPPDAPVDSDHAHDAGHHNPYLAHHFDSMQQQFASAKLGMWVFLATEILMFGGLFCAYAFYRGNHPDMYLFAHYFLDTNLGFINTIILLASSFTMAWGVRAAMLGQKKLLQILLILTLVGGLGFMVIKTFEYASKYNHNLWFGPGNAFYFQGADHSNPDDLEHALKYHDKKTHGKHGGEAKHDEAHDSDKHADATHEHDHEHTADDKPTPELVDTQETPETEVADSAEAQEAAEARAVWPPRPDSQGRYVGGDVGTAPSGIEVAFVKEPERTAKPASHQVVAFDDLSPLDQERAHLFFQIYFLMTGLHGLHVLIGMGLIGWILWRATKGAFGPQNFTAVDLVGLYWHLVDLIWIFLFPLLYLIH